MRKQINPQGIKENPTYSHGVLLEAPMRWLAIAGQVGRNKDGFIPEGIEAQAEIAWHNVAIVLEEANMSFADLLSVTIYLTRTTDRPTFDLIRLKWLSGARPACTKIFVSELAHPDLLCEIQALAVSSK